MEAKLKEQLIKSVNNIKQKIRMIKNEDDAASIKLKRVFKPITDPLDTLIKTNKLDNHTKNEPILKNNNTIDDLSSSIDYEDFENFAKKQSSINEDSEYYDYDEEKRPVEEQIKSQTKKNDTLKSLGKEDIMDIYEKIKVPFGIRSENKKLMIGNSTVHINCAKNKSFNNKNIYTLTIQDKRYDLTPGLKELLIRNKPDLQAITAKDKIVYKDILEQTNAHKRDFHPHGQIKGDKGLKYRCIIKPMFGQNEQSFGEKTVKKTGGYIPKIKKYKSNTDYVYWDDPNELIDRLKLLIASQSAGNTNHDNEIVSIIEELKEAGIIKE